MRIIDGDLSIKRKKANIDCKQLCSKEMAKRIVPLHYMYFTVDFYIVNCIRVHYSN